MDNEKIGKIIRSLRLEKDMTQKDLAEKLNLTVQAVSKWERGWGLPDISLLPALAEILQVDLKEMLEGELNHREFERMNMKETKLYICPNCGNLSLCTGKAAVTCCGRQLDESVPVKADDKEKMTVEKVENDWYISSDHPMTKEDYISFSAFLMNGKIEVYKHYPEWKMELRIPRIGHGTFLWFSEKEGLFFQRL